MHLACSGGKSTHFLRFFKSTYKTLYFVDDTTGVGLISGGDKSAYRGEVWKLSSWCSVSNLTLNPPKNRKEFIIDFRKGSRVQNLKFLGTHISDNLTSSVNTSATVKKAQKRMHFLGILKRNRLNVQPPLAFRRSATESILVYCITVWYAVRSAADKKALQGG